MLKAAQLAANAASALLATATAYTQTGASGMKSMAAAIRGTKTPKLLQVPGERLLGLSTACPVRLDTGRVGMAVGINGIIQGVGMGFMFVPLSVPRWRPWSSERTEGGEIGSYVIATNWLLAAPNVAHLLSPFTATRPRLARFNRGASGADHLPYRRLRAPNDRLARGDAAADDPQGLEAART